MHKKLENLLAFFAIVLLSTQGFATQTELISDIYQGQTPEDTPCSVLDQHQETYNDGAAFWADEFFAQTFIPSMSRQLHHVDLNFCEWKDPPSFPATISIVETFDGEPSETLLGSVTEPSLTSGWYSFDFVAESVMLTSGVQYGIVIFNDDPSSEEPSDWVSIQWNDDPYPGGTFWRWTSTTGWEIYSIGTPGDADMAFRTWMVPEPATPLLLCIGGLALLRKRRS